MAKLLPFSRIQQQNSQPNAADCLEQLYRQNYKRLCAAAGAAVRDKHLAQDAVQEAWLRLNRPETLAGIDASDPDRVLGLMLVTVRNAARNLARKDAKEQPLPQEDWMEAETADPAPRPQEQAEQREAAAALKAGLKRLPELDQAILQLRYDNGCTGKQVAALLDLNEETVRVREHRARKRLKKILETEGY